MPPYRKKSGGRAVLFICEIFLLIIFAGWLATAKSFGEAFALLIAFLLLLFITFAG
jgi:hypothetical protein